MKYMRPDPERANRPQFVSPVFGDIHAMRHYRTQAMSRNLLEHIEAFIEVSDYLVAGVLTLPTPLGIELSHDNRVMRETLFRLRRYLKSLDADPVGTPGSEPPPTGKRFHKMSLTDPIAGTEHPYV